MKSWKDIKFRTAKKLLELEGKELEPLDLVINQLAILEGKSVADIEDMTPDDIFKEWEKWRFTQDLPRPKKIDLMKWDGIDYGMTPLNKISLAQMVDIEEFYKEGLDKNIEKIISILFLPIKNKTLWGKIELESYEFDEGRVEAILEQDMEFVWSNLLFFWTGAERYIRGLRDFSAVKGDKTRTIQIYNNILMIEAGMLKAGKEGGLLQTLKKKINQTLGRNGGGSH